MSGPSAPSGRAASKRRGPAPSSIALLVALLLSAGAATAILLDRRVTAGALVLAGGAAIQLGWFFADRERTARARFAAMLLDPLLDAGILATVAWASRGPEPGVGALALVALGLCYLAAYERARADALGFRTFESVGYRAVRSALIGLGLVTGWMAGALWLLIAVSGAAVAARARNVAVQHRNSKVAAHTPGTA
jgi:hypothetical protein